MGGTKLQYSLEWRRYQNLLDRRQPQVEPSQLSPPGQSGESCNLSAGIFPSGDHWTVRRPNARSRIALVAGGGFEPPTFGL